MKSKQLPLFVDLDGTLIASDSLLECLVQCAKKNPAEFLHIIAWLARGRAYLKARLAADYCVDVSRLPYRKDLCEYLHSERQKGRSIFLATAADSKIAQRVSEHLGFFDGTLASDGQRNLKGERKLDAIKQVAKNGFAYAGNSRDDMPIFAAADKIIFVNAPRSVTKRMQLSGNVEGVFPSNSVTFRELIKAARVHQWLKNLLVFVPLLTSFRLLQADSVLRSISAFLLFSVCASATYIFNDLIDLESDRIHPRKRNRPLASGRLSIPAGLIGAGVAMCLGIVFAFSLSFEVGMVLLTYVALTMAYSLYFKSHILMDVIVLAALYTSRIIGGAVAINESVSTWLLAFSLFLFLSLALLKRCSELITMKSRGITEIVGRDYFVGDSEVLWPMGLATAASSVVVFALFINSGEMAVRYGTRNLLWIVTLIFFYWLGRMWIKTSRGQMTDDPIVFAIKDFGSRVLISAMIVIVIVAYFFNINVAPHWIRP